MSDTETAELDKSQTVENETPPEETVEVPDYIFLNDMHDEPVSALHEMAGELPIRTAGNSSKFQLIRDILGYYGQNGTRIEVEGIMENSGNAQYGILRWQRFNFSPTQDSVYVSASMIREHQLQPGLKLRGVVSVPRQKDKFFALDELLAVEGTPVEKWQAPESFDKLTPLFPQDRLILENSKVADGVTGRVIDIMAPLGKGQRGLIVAPPRSGKTIILKEIAKAVRDNHPEVELIVLLIDERPEEVTDFKETVDANVYSSTFDETAARHLQVSDVVLDRAKRLVELKKDVVILLDSLTRLTRGYNSCRGKKGAVGSGGINPWALQRARRFFSAARNVEEGGSLTIIATALVETESRMDEVIFEEFKGTGNLEIQLDRELVENRIFPAIHLLKSATRKDELLYHPDELAKVNQIRKELAQIPAMEALQKLVHNIENTESNIELVLRGLK